MKQMLFTKPCACKATALALSALALSSAFVGCTDYCEFTEDQIRFTFYNEDYDQAFIKRFGEPNPNNDWGFTELKPLQSLGGSFTRANTGDFESGNGTVLVNRNQWIERDANQGSGYHDKPFKNDALAHDFQIPGWPNFDGKYYGSTGAGALQGTLTPEELDTKGNSWQPVGDVTEFEIQYVSAWFRTHEITNPDDYRFKLHLSDFFIQNISQDEDQDTYTEFALTADNLTNKSVRKNGDNIGNLASGYKTDYIWRQENSSERITYSLDNLGFQAIDKTWTHVNNFNNGNANINPEESNENPQREIKFIKSSGTENFHCHPSWNTDPETDWIDSWVLVHLTWIEQGVQRDGYYLAFDFHAGKNETKVYQDHYYSNWIVKITPAYFNPESNKAKRVMVEDLGGTFDFDFNDVVFDVAYENYDNQDQAIITLQAAGGTMPIVVGMTDNEDSEHPKPNEDYEVHKMMGNGAMNPTNVGAGHWHEVATYRVPMTGTNLGHIKIWVKNTKFNMGWVSYSGGNQTWLNLDNGADNPYGDHKTPNSSTERLKAPRAFAVPLRSSIEIKEEEEADGTIYNIETRWMKENQCINETYYEFDDWVRTESKSDTGFGMDKKRGWWEQAINTDKLYIKSINPADDNPSYTGNSAPAAWVPLTPQFNHKCYADYYLDINGYDGTDAIKNEINKSTTTQVTFTIVFESATQQTIDAILIPADVETDDGTTKMSYKGTVFTSYNSSDTESEAKAKITNVFTKWQTAVESENRYASTKNEETGETKTTYTYVCRFTFTKEQLQTNSDKLSDYIFLYVKSTDPVTIPKHPSVDNKWQWYIHY